MFDWLRYRDLLIMIWIHPLWFWSYEFEVKSAWEIYAEVWLMPWLLWAIGVGQHCDNFTEEYTYYLEICNQAHEFWIYTLWLWILNVYVRNIMDDEMWLYEFITLRFWGKSSCLDGGYYKKF